MTATTPTPSVVSSVGTLVRSPAPALLLGHRRPGRSLSPLTTGRARRARRVVAARRRPADRDVRPDLEGLRALAVVALVVHHAGLALPGGDLGVDVLLVVSGFVLTRRLLQQVGRGGFAALPGAYARRLRRLLPAAVVVALTTVVALRVGHAAGPQVGAGDHLGAAADTLLRLWPPLLLVAAAAVVWPLVVALAAVVTRRRHLRLVLALVVTGVVAATAYASAAGPASTFSATTGVWELGLGALVALAAKRLVAIPRRLAGAAAWLGVAAVVLAVVRPTEVTTATGLAALLPAAGAALVAASGCGPRVGVERVLGEPLMQCLGRVSYSWYLWHGPLLLVTPSLLGHALGVGERLAVVWVSLAVAVACFTWVEQPLRAGHRPGRSRLAAAATVAALAAAAAAVVVLAPVLPTTGA